MADILLGGFQSDVWGCQVPKASEPRVVVRMSPEDYAVVRAAADVANIAVGALVRECSVRYAATVAADVRRGSTSLRRGKAVEAVRGQVAPARSLVVRGSAEEWARDRQRRLNEAAERSRAKR